jgi:hypothetical protein
MLLHQDTGAVVIYLAWRASVSLGEQQASALTDRLSATERCITVRFCMNKISPLAAINNAAPHISASFFSEHIPFTTT